MLPAAAIVAAPQTLNDKPAPMQKRLIPLLACLLLLTACSGLRFPGVYRIDIEQGNIVDDNMMEKLTIGMTEAQVQFVMGSPQLTDPFDPNHWIYNYRLRRGDGTVVANRIGLWFENGTLVRQEGSALPAAARARINTSGTKTSDAKTSDADNRATTTEPDVEP